MSVTIETVSNIIFANLSMEICGHYYQQITDLYSNMRDVALNDKKLSIKKKIDQDIDVIVKQLISEHIIHINNIIDKEDHFKKYFYVNDKILENEIKNFIKDGNLLYDKFPTKILENHKNNVKKCAYKIINDIVLN